MTGNEAVAHGMRQIDPDVVAAYPITPQTDIVQYFSSFVSNGQVKTEFVTVESEHSAMSATLGASMAGARAMTATSSQGLALMWEILHIASSYRAPIVMPVVNRALSGPINIHCDHSDTMGSLTTGWIQIYAESAQEAYDNLIQAVRIAEHPDVLLPVMVCQDGFITSHGIENLNLLPDEVVKEFVGEYKPKYALLDIENPITVGPLALQDYYTEVKVQQAEAMKNAKQVILDVAEEYAKISGRKYGLFEAYKLDDAERAIVVLSSTAGTAKAVVDNLRAKGEKVGLLKPRVLRPFPAKELVDALSSVQAVAVMDRAETFSTAGGQLFVELRSAFYESEKRPLMKNYIFGLGGRDTTTREISRVFEDLAAALKKGRVEELITHLDVRE
ncbi:MAG: pyruvate ferredoxin oxidoreductase [Bacillota bacterium]|jgi:pyruvate ferredoxin oxidoreductase alpha subunit|nr:pyruvate ferredoxin oxidoreductase [Candidatus Fermentithermobacillaceae bacterium]HOA71372.1 pyruvate ferredoxin oxidoreductase [Bacillota bacterium]HOP70595.1 pyruvate ferredoxin oxidoreductase [Bacillota bacterium]HPT36120.1 pyruvate ferredoxin oxidoreductase [Bacillota bacterium]HPZ85849.1 pyruvate ferredoxin oxidoreductase [Bacillota bacterium]